MANHELVPQQGPKKLRRSTSDKMLGGVLAGVGEYLGVDPTVVRVLYALASIASAGLGVIVYIILMLIVPERR